MKKMYTKQAQKHEVGQMPCVQCTDLDASLTRKLGNTKTNIKTVCSLPAERVHHLSFTRLLLQK